MRYYLLLLFSFSISNWAFSNELCSNQAELFGEKNKISSSCINYIKNNTPVKNIKKHTTKDMTIFAKGNIIVISTQGKKNNIIAGKNTQLEEIVSIDLSNDGKNIYVLNKQNNLYSILIFKTKVSGNIKPRIIFTPEIQNARSVTISPLNKTLFILVEDKIISYNSNMNSRSRRENLKPANKLIFQNDSFKNAEQIMSSEKQVFILNNQEKKLFMIANKAPQSFSYADFKDYGISHIQEMKYLEKSNSLVLKSAANKSVELTLE